MWESALSYPDLRLSEWVVACDYILSTPVPLARVSVLQEGLKSRQVVWGSGEVYLFLLNVPNDCSTARDVVELSLSDGYIGANWGDFYQVVVSGKVMSELAPFNE